MQEDTVVALHHHNIVDIWEEKGYHKTDGYRQNSTVMWYSVTGSLQTFFSHCLAKTFKLCAVLAWLEFISQLCLGFILSWSLFPQRYLECEVVCLLLYYNIYRDDACRENHMYECLENQNVMCMCKYIVLRAWFFPSCKLWCHFELWTGSASKLNVANTEL